MAFFKFRKNGAEQSGPAPVPESLEVLRKRARHRLMGAAALVLLGVVGFPVLFDSQPRPVAVDIAIDIPDKAKAAPLSAAPASAAPVAAVGPAPESPSKSASAAPAVIAATAAAAATAVATSPKAPTVVPPVTPASKAEAKAEAKPEVQAKVEPKPAPKPEPKPEPKAATKPDEKAQTSGKAQALLDGKDPAKAAAAAPRYTVQVGAFADAKKVQEVRTTLEKAGIKTYSQIVTTADGKRTRVRAGPWENKAEADKTAEKIKKLNLPAAVLTL